MIEYDVAKAPYIVDVSAKIKDACIFLHKEERITTVEKGKEKIIRSKYLCPCGAIDIREEKRPNIHKVYIVSEKCGI